MAPTYAESGFTLVAAMVALMVFALACVGLAQMQAQSLRTLSDVERTTLAQIVAHNELVEISAARRPPDLGAREGESELGGQRWRWRLTVSETSSPGARRAEIQVSTPQGEAVAREHAFVPVAGAS